MASLHPVLAAASAVLLDFDGPVCAAFTGVDQRVLVDRLRALLVAHGVAVPDVLHDETDPLAWLRAAAGQDPALVAALHDEVTAQELAGVGRATLTPGIADLVAAVLAAGIPVAVVSNNAAAAVRAFLPRCLPDLVGVPVVGRPPEHPDRMKPHPAGVRTALAALGATPAAAVLIGDSATDLEVARAAGTRVVAFANRPAKVARFTALAPDVLVEHLTQLLTP